MRAGLTLVVLTLCFSCSEPPRPRGDVIARWIETDPETVLGADDLFPNRLEMQLGPTDEASADKWVGHDVELHGLLEGKLQIQKDGADPWIARDVDINAAAVYAIEADVMNHNDEEVQLFWSTRWRRFSTNRMERAVRDERLNHNTTTIRFEVGNNPAWTGRINRLRIDLPPGIDTPVSIGEVRVYQRVVDAEQLAAAVERPWKVNLGTDTRNVLLAPPGTLWAQRVSVPDDAHLTFGFGVQPSVKGSVRFEITAVDPDGKRSVIFSDTARAGKTGKGRWFDAAIPLDKFSGRDIDFILSTRAGGRYLPSQGLPVWANPEVVAPRQPDHRPNVVIILLDTLRADRLSCYGHDRETSPHMDLWASRSAVRFANTVAPAPWTLPSHASIFTGLDAVRHGFNYWGSAPPSLEMLAEVLRRNAYTTAAVTGGGILRPRFGFAQGFDSFEYWGHRNSDGEAEWVFDRARQWIRANHDRRFFLFVHTYEVHYPHRRRQPFFDRFATAGGLEPADGTVQMRSHGWEGLLAPGDFFVIRRPGSDDFAASLTESEIETVSMMYDSAVATVDLQVRHLLDELQTLGLKGRTLVVVTSDHGEALGEDGRAGHAYLEDYNLMVPLILELPGESHAGAVIDRQVRLVDLMPTVLDVAGIDLDHPIDGRSLVPILDDPDVEFPERAWAYAASSNLGLAMRVDNRLKYVFPDAAWAELAGGERLFDLTSDPSEHHDLAPQDDRLDELRATTGRTILEQHQGLRLQLRNSGRDALTGHLVGAWASHDRVKTDSHDCACVHWIEGAPASFELQTGQDATLLFHQLADLEVGLVAKTASPDGEVSSEVCRDLDLSTISIPAAIHLTEDGWRLVEDFEDTLETGFLITRVGDAEISSSEPHSDDETLNQLRALGYVQ